MMLGGGAAAAPCRFGLTPNRVTSVTLKAWYRADAVTLVSGNVSQFTDLSGNGYHLTQASGANRPLFEAAGYNGQPSIKFDGANHWLENTASMAAGVFNGVNTPFSVYLVWQPISVAGVQVIFSAGALGGAQYYLQDLSSGAFLREKPGATSVNGGASSIVAGTKYIERTFSNGSTITVKQNKTTTAVNGSAFTSVNNLSCTNVTLGAWASSTVAYRSDARVAELFIFGNVPNATEDLLLGNYLQNMYQIANG